MRYDTLELNHHEVPKRTNWRLVAAALGLVYVLLIGGMEVFWFYFAGGVSPLMGGFAFVAATLVAIRVVGEIVSARSRTF